jgi:hypothetical protein
MFRGHPNIQARRNRIGNRLRHLETRPAPVFFVPPGALLACIVEKQLPDGPPGRVAAVQADRIDGLDFKSTVATATRDAQHMALDLGQPPVAQVGCAATSTRVP